MQTDPDVRNTWDGVRTTTKMIPCQTQWRRIHWNPLQCSRPCCQIPQNRLTRVTGIWTPPKLLTELRLRSNFFNMKLPSEIMNLGRLKKLYILHNPGISGNVPSRIRKMNGMMDLELSFTSLHGNIPSEFLFSKTYAISEWTTLTSMVMSQPIWTTWSRSNTSLSNHCILLYSFMISQILP